jgi:hypothetical protein
MSRRRTVIAAAIVAVVFALGVAVGEALHDNPKPGITVTNTKTLNP